MLHDIDTWAKFARVWAEDNHISLKFHDKGNTAYTTADTLYVPKPNPLWEREDLVKWLRYVFHEIGHHDPEVRGLWKELNDNKDKYSANPNLLMIVNILEDFRQEKAHHGIYSGRDKILEEGRCLEFPSIGPSLKNAKPFVQGLLAYDNSVRARTFQPAVADYEKFIALSKEGEEVVSQLEADERVVREYPGLSTIDNVISLAEHIHKLLSVQEPPVCAKPSGKGKKKSDGKGGSASRTDSEYIPGLTHDHTTQPDDPTGDRDPSDWTSTSSDTYRSFLPDEHDIIGATEANSARLPYIEDGAEPISIPRTPLSLIRLLITKTVTHKVRGMPSGSLDTRNLHKLLHSGTRRIFKRDTIAPQIDTALLLLIDHSGSMGRRRSRIAAEAALNLAVACNSTGINLAIYGFTTKNTRHRLLTVKHKEFNGSKNLLHIQKSLSTVRRDENADGDSILYAYHQLKKQPQAKKILIVLSDGVPMVPGRGSIENYTKKVIHRIQQDPDVLLLSIGIETSYVKYYYKNWYVLETVNKLPEVIRTIVQRHSLT